MADIEKQEPKMSPTVNSSPDRKAKEFRAWSFAAELGYTIAIPIVIFALVGRLADKSFHTAPWLLLAGILISMFISSWLIYRKVKEIM